MCIDDCSLVTPRCTLNTTLHRQIQTPIAHISNSILRTANFFKHIKKLSPTEENILQACFGLCKKYEWNVIFLTIIQSLLGFDHCHQQFDNLRESKKSRIWHCLIVKYGDIYEQQALSNSCTRKDDQKVLQEPILGDGALEQIFWNNKSKTIYFMNLKKYLLLNLTMK